MWIECYGNLFNMDEIVQIGRTNRCIIFYWARRQNDQTVEFKTNEERDIELKRIYNLLSQIKPDSNVAGR